eukprot:1968048-Rhodomonas_salina.1
MPQAAGRRPRGRDAPGVQKQQTSLNLFFAAKVSSVVVPVLGVLAVVSAGATKAVTTALPSVDTATRAGATALMSLSGHVEHIEVISDTEATGTDTATHAPTEALDDAAEGSDSEGENIGAELKEYPGYPMYNWLGHELSRDVGEMIATAAHEREARTRVSHCADCAGTNTPTVFASLQGSRTPHIFKLISQPPEQPCSMPPLSFSRSLSLRGPLPFLGSPLPSPSPSQRCQSVSEPLSLPPRPLRSLTPWAGAGRQSTCGTWACTSRPPLSPPAPSPRSCAA